MPGGPVRQRNGYLQACDTCRRRKVSCDHAQPTCSRCRKGRIRCTYTVSEHTILPPKDRPTSRAGSREAAAPSPEGPAQPSSIAPKSLASRRSTNWAATGYLGYTSYSTVMEETLSILTGQPEKDSPSALADDSRITISRTILQLGVAVLSHVPDAERGYSLLKLPKFMDTWIYTIALRILDSLYREYGAFLGKNRSLAQLERMAKKICHNTAKPACDNRGGPDEWLAQFVGQNLRWESIGLLFNYWDLLADPAGPERNLPKVRPLAGIYSPVAHECLIRCVDLSQEFSQGNVFLLFLHYRQTNLESLVTGEAGRQVWRSHAATVSALTFFGIHAETDDPDYRPSLPSEAKRRVLAAIVSVDKELAAFTGRLPLLSQRFTTSPMPLDIKDEYLFMDEATLCARAKDALDDQGWNIEGGVYASTVLRANTIFARLREQIIEIALGSESTTSIADILKLKALHVETVAQLPEHLTYSPGDVLDPALEMNHIQLRFWVRMERLQNEFYMDRLLLRKGYEDDGSLLTTSFDMLATYISFWVNRDRYSRMRGDCGWACIGYGAPAGGILCKELLRPTFGGQHPRNPAITRSSIIQKLSSFVDCLEWVVAWGSNRDLCRECKSAIQRVLDHALNTTYVTQETTDSVDWDFPVPLDFNFDLLESFNYLRSGTQMQH